MRLDVARLEAVGTNREVVRRVVARNVPLVRRRAERLAVEQEARARRRCAKAQVDLGIGGRGRRLGCRRGRSPLLRDEEREADDRQRERLAMRESALLRAQTLSELGVGASDRVAVMTSDGREFLAAVFGAMYLGATLYRIHGSNEPETIGHAVSSGCIRMTNEDVTDLYNRVSVGTTVVVGN